MTYVAFFEDLRYARYARYATLRTARRGAGSYHTMFAFAFKLPPKSP